MTTFITDYAIYCSTGLYENKEFHKLYSINNRDLIAYSCKLATSYTVEDSLYQKHIGLLERCKQLSFRNKRMFVKVDIDEEHIIWVRAIYGVDEILGMITGEQFQELINRYYKHWDIIREKRIKLEQISKEIENLEKERDLLVGWIPIGLYDADDRLYESEEEDADESDSE